MKRYWLFCYETYYPMGGMQDFIGDFDSIKVCNEAYENQDRFNYEIFDSKERVIVECNWLPDYNEVHNVNDPLFDLSHLSELYPKKLWKNEKQ